MPGVFVWANYCVRDKFLYFCGAGGMDARRIMRGVLKRCFIVAIYKLPRRHKKPRPVGPGFGLKVIIVT